MKVTLGLAPQQFFRFQVGAPGDGISHAVERRVGQHKEIIAVDLEVIQPGIFGEAVQLLARREATIYRWLVNVQRLAATDEQTPGQVHRLADEELLRVAVDELHLQGFVGQVYAGHLARCREGEQAQGKMAR